MNFNTSTTRVNYQGKAFWIEDGFIEILSHFVCDAFETIGLDSFNVSLKDIYEDCDMNRKYPDNANILLNEYITNPMDAATLINVLEQAKSFKLAYGTEITTQQLNLLEAPKDVYFRNNWIVPIKTASLITTIIKIQQLLDGTFPAIVKSYHYQGFPGARPGEEII